MGLSNGLYVEVNLACILILLRIVVKLHTDYNKQFELRLFSYVLISTISFMFFDMAWIFISFFLKDNIYANYAINILYFISSAFIGYTWFLYSRSVLDYKKESPLMNAIMLIPFLLLILLSISSPFTHLIFYIENNSQYQRGKFHFVQVICMNIYFIIVSGHALKKAFSKNEIANAKQYLSLFTFMVLSVSTQIIQSFLPGYATISIGLSLGLLNVYFELRESVITIDQLTQINNRNVMYKYLSAKYKLHTQENFPNNNIYIIFIDVNNFRNLNDVYGYSECDNILKMISITLKKIAGRKNCFICRYGGDEFAIIAENRTESDIIDICNDVKESVEKDNLLAGNIFDLSVSTGYAKRENTTSSIKEFINLALQNLEQNKTPSKRGRFV